MVTTTHNPARSIRTLALAMVLAALTLSACSPGFDPFNLVNKPRVLAVQADPPTLRFGETATIRALSFSPEGEEASFRWSWCPLSLGAIGGFECAIDEQDLRALADAIVPGAGATIPSFDLGQEPQAAFDYTINPLLLAGICEASISEEIPAFITLPSCDRALTITVRLDAEIGDEKITAAKELSLAFDEGAPVNANPSLGALRAVDESADGSEIVLGEDEPAELIRGRSYRLEVDVPDDASEQYLPAPTDDEPEPEAAEESLFMSWYVTGGETEFGRTTYFPDTPELDELGVNSWDTPERDDYEDDEARLFLVIQDQRGGLGWIERSVRLVEKAK